MNSNTIKLIIAAVVIGGSYSIVYLYIVYRKLDSNALVAVANIILAVITFSYASFTKSMLEEQQKSRQIEYIEKKLEKAYNPIEEAINIFEFDKNGTIKLDVTTTTASERFSKFDSKLREVRKNYSHLIDDDIIHNHQDIWNFHPEYKIFDANSLGIITKYHHLIDRFHGDIIEKKRQYQIELERLQGVNQ